MSQHGIRIGKCDHQIATHSRRCSESLPFEFKGREISSRGAPASRRLWPASCRTRVFANEQAIDQQMMPFRQGNFFTGSACVPQAAFGILPGAGFYE
jgi:hypothetical protein